MGLNKALREYHPAVIHFFLYIYIYVYICIYVNILKKNIYIYINTHDIPVVPHKAVAEVSKIGNL